MRPERTLDQPNTSAWHPDSLRLLLRLVVAMVLGMLVVALAYQLPVTHTIAIGERDSAYVQGFYDPERPTTQGTRPDLAGAQGGARWTQATSYLLLPQAGLPAQVTLRLRGWRASGNPPEVEVRLGGGGVLGRFRTSGDWEERHYTISGGMLKSTDVVIELHAETAPLSADDPRPVGILLDSATYQVSPAPILPYPSQLAYAALAGGLLAMLLMPGQQWRVGRWRLPPAWCWLGGMVLIGGLFLALVRAQPPYPYPLRGLLPALDALLLLLLALRIGPALARRVPALPDGAALAGIGVWLLAVLRSAQQHIVISAPGVERDFSVFALRSARLFGTFQPSGSYNASSDGVLRADGFYNLGYPLVLWLVRPLTHDNPFLAARLVAAFSGALLLGATWWLARTMLGRGPALLALLALALSPLTVEYGLYLGTDMPFAAMCTLALALLVAAHAHGAANTPTTAPAPTRQYLYLALAGLVAGAAFLVRHPGILLLPIGWLAIWLPSGAPQPPAHASWPARWRARFNTAWTTFTLAWLLASLPQLAINSLQTGQPLYSEQADNIWLCVYANCDWGRQAETPEDLTLGAIVAQDPGRFLTNWWLNVRSFIGSGAEDTSEFGRALQLRLLAFPANWLAIIGVLGWLAVLARQYTRYRGGGETAEPPGDYRPLAVLLGWVALSVLTVSVGLALQPRFVLPLAPVYAVAAAWTLAVVQTRTRLPAAQVAMLALLLGLLWGGFSTGTRYVLDHQQPDEAAIVRLTQATLGPGERVLVGVPPRILLGKYSAIAHVVTPAPDSTDPAVLRASGAQLLLWSAARGQPPQVGPLVGQAGVYALYRLTP